MIKKQGGRGQGAWEMGAGEMGAGEMGKESIKSHDDLEVYKMAFDAAMKIFFSIKEVSIRGDRLRNLWKKQSNFGHSSHFN